jgi:putative tryptophan/tyrosine transport system substrate-binding protein
MTRVLSVVLLIVPALATQLAVEAQPPPKTVRIGWLGTSSSTTGAGSIYETAFMDRLRELGYVEGENLAVERRYSEGHDNRLPDLAAALVRLKVDVIVATGGQPPFAAKRATSRIPIVFTNNGDPVGSGLVSSLARPGGNVTGLSLASAEITGKRLQLLKEAVPGVTRVAILSNPTSPIQALMLKEVKIAAAALHLQLQFLDARSPDEVTSVLSMLTRERADALIILGHPMLAQQRGRIAALTAKSRMPAMAAQREYAEAGSLMAYGASLPEMYRRAATYVDKILKGAKPGDLPIEQPTKFEFVVNLKTAKTLGLTIPPAVLARADEVIQ